jgi:hypothetical protein
MSCERANGPVSASSLESSALLLEAATLAPRLLRLLARPLARVLLPMGPLGLLVWLVLKSEAARKLALMGPTVARRPRR